jgi:hypothetical protein
VGQGATDLNVRAAEDIKMNEAFGKMDELLKKAGIAGTFQLTDERTRDSIVSAACKLSKDTGKPVIIVIRLR